jgi:Ca2+-binding RTX toxin-like protein
MGFRTDDLTHYVLINFSTRLLGQNLLPGFYDDAGRFFSVGGSHPEMSVDGWYIGANMLTGNFTVVAAEFDYSGPSPTVVTLSIEFEEHSLDSAGPAVFGTIDINRPTDPLVDNIFEAAGEGIDTVQSAVTFALPANVEHLVLTGSAAIDGTGNGLDNTITGNGAANTLEGGGGSDRFVFATAPDGTSNVDTITDFAAGGDKIVLDDDVFTALTAGALPAGAFASGSGATAGLDADDRLVYNTASGALYYDEDGAGGVAAVQIAVLAGAPVLAAGDIEVIA